MGYKIWLDDKRSMPKKFDFHCFSAQGAIDLIKCLDIDEISFDHDLGNERFVGNGYDVARFIEEEAYFKRLKLIKWNIHSANPVGEKNIKTALSNAERFWNNKRD